MARARLSDDLIIEILSKLPVDSLVRFKGVQKSWSSLFESDFFVTKHSRNYVYSDVCLLVKSTSDHQRRVVSTLSLFTHDENNTFSPMKDVDLSFCKDFYASSMTANVEGYICFYGAHSQNIAIANPGIRKFWRLPESSVPIPVIYGERCGCHNGQVGIGIDPNTNDLKIVRVLNICLSSLTPVGNKAEVYTLSSDSWRQIDFPGQLAFFYASCFYDTRMDSYWNGAYHWTVQMEYYTHKEGRDHGSGILSFDMSDEAFQFRPLPLDFVSRPPGIGILEYNGTLALISFSCREGEEKLFELWSLDDFWVQKTLTKLLVIGPILEVERPLLFLNEHQLLVVASNKQVMSFNINTKHFDHLLPAYCRENYDRIVVCKRSLYW